MEKAIISEIKKKHKKQKRSFKKEACEILFFLCVYNINDKIFKKKNIPKEESISKEE